MSKHFNIKIRLLYLFLTGFISLQSQVLVNRPKGNMSEYKRELSFLIGPTYTQMQNNNLDADKYADNRGKIVPLAGINYHLPFSKYVGYNFGFEYNQIINQAIYRGYFRSATTKVDARNYIYYPIVDANYTNTLKLTSIDIPVNLRLNFEPASNLKLYIESGLKLNVVLNLKQTKEGSLSKKGLYPLINGGNSQYYLIENDPGLGYITTTYSNEEKSIETTKVAYSFVFAAGMKAFVSQKLFMNWNIFYLSGLSDLMPNESEYLNVFGEKRVHTKYTAFQIGIKLGVGITLD